MSIVLSVAAFTALLFMLYTHLRRHCTDTKSGSTPLIRSNALVAPFRIFPYIGTLSFFMDPPSFFSACMECSVDRAFSFQILSHKVIVVRGFSGRDVFFAKGLDFLAGYKLLNPQLKEFLPRTPLTGDQSWGAVVASFSRPAMIEKLYSTMLNLVATGYDAWGDEGSIDLFRAMNQVIFAVSLPLAGCQHLAKNPDTVATLLNIFERLNNGSTPSALILPWMPTPTRIRRFLAGVQLYRITKTLVEEWTRLGLDEEDPLQTLTKQNYPISELARFIATVMFAAVANTANVLAWALVYLEHHKKWKDRVWLDVATFLRDNDLEGSANLADAMANIPLAVLEEKMQNIDLVIHEVLRLQASGPFIRRNIGDSVTQDGTRIENGAYIMFPAADLHRDPELFPNPNHFDPSRFAPEEAERRKKHGTSFIGFGAGRHACVGKRVALLEIKMMIVLLVAKYDFTLVDDTGSQLRGIPSPDVVQLFKICEPKRPVHVLYRARDCAAGDI